MRNKNNNQVISISAPSRNENCIEEVYLNTQKEGK